MTLELWIHLATFVVGALMAPMLWTLMTTLVRLQRSADLLAQSMDNQVKAFERHMDEDSRVRAAFDRRLTEVSDHLQEVRGVLFGRRQPHP